MKLETAAKEAIQDWQELGKVQPKTIAKLQQALKGLELERDEDDGAPLLLTHRGIEVFHVLKHGEQGPVSQYFYQAGIGGEFDVRNLKGYKSGLSHRTVIKRVIDKRGFDARDFL